MTDIYISSGLPYFIDCPITTFYAEIWIDDLKRF